MKTKQQAQAEALACKRRMRFGKWKVSVSKNIDWYWCLEGAGAVVTVWPSDGKFNCLIAPPGSWRCGSTDWSSHKTFKDPNNAVTHTLKLMWEYVSKMREHSQKIDEAMGLEFL